MPTILWALWLDAIREEVFMKNHAWSLLEREMDEQKCELLSWISITIAFI